jgi:hypothetical protein
MFKLGKQTACARLGNEVDAERGCMYVSERFYTIAGEWFEDNYVGDDVCTLLQQWCGRGLGYRSMVVRCRLHYLLEYLEVIQADTGLEFQD